ncbi:MAG: cupin domain-containing protein [Cyanobacteria bacterium J06626_18]
MRHIGQVQVQRLSSERSGSSEFYTLQPSDQTMLVQVGAGVIEDLFVHHAHTDQLLVVQGSLVLVVLQNRQYEYIALNGHTPTVVTIPSGVPHGAINLSPETCTVVNSVLRHGPPHEKDYRPFEPPFPYDIARALQLTKETTDIKGHTPLLKVL